jgi:WD40 repeat protein
MAFAAGGNLLATAGYSGNVRLWDVTDPTKPHRFGHVSTRNVNSMALAPDGQTLVVTDASGETLLWDLTDRFQPRQIGQPLPGDVQWLAFARDESILVTALDSGEALLWDLGPLNSVRQHALERACSVTGGGMDREEWGRYAPAFPYIDACR